MSGTGTTTTSGQRAHDDSAKVVDELLRGMGNFVVEATLRNRFPLHLTSDELAPANTLTPAQERMAYVLQAMHHVVDSLWPFSGPNPDWSAFKARSDEYGPRAELAVKRLAAIADSLESLTPDGEELVGHAKAAARIFRQALKIVKGNVDRMQRGEAINPNFDDYYFAGVRRAQQAARLLTPDTTVLSN